MNISIHLQQLTAFIEQSLGIIVKPIPDGRFHRYPAPGKQATNKACWLILTEDGSLAYCGSFITGESFVWRAYDTVAIREPSESEAEIEEKKRAFLLKYREESKEKAKQKAKQLLKLALPANVNHPYLISKNIPSSGLLQNGQEVLIPLQDISGKVSNLQRIYPDGSKYFLKGGQVSGLFAVCGELFITDIIYICEGYATASTLHLATSQTAVAAINAGNLLSVCQLLDSVKPDHIEIIVAADNDHLTAGNPGLTKGIEAAKAIAAAYIFPPFPCNYRPCKCTDFNDLENCPHHEEVSS